MTQTAPATFDNFNGGITDYYVNGPVNKYRHARNLLIEKYSDTVGKLISRPGSEIYDASNPQLPSGAQRVGTLHFHDFSSTLLLAQSARSLYYVTAGAWAELLGPSSNKLLPSGITVDNVVGLTEANHVTYFATDAFTRPQKVFRDSLGALKLRTLGLPALASTPTCAATGTGRIFTYRFVQAVTYTVGNRTFVTRSAATEVQEEGVNPVGPAGDAVAIAAIPTLANGLIDNYDTAVVKIEIYRAVENTADEFFKVGEVTNGTAVFSDTMTDATLVNQLPLYTNGGVLDFTQSPKCKMMHVVGDLGYFGAVYDGTDYLLNRLQQSMPGVIDASDPTFYCEFDQDMVGLSSVKGKPVALLTKGVARVDGTFGLQGQGYMQPEKIDDRATCIGQSSVVQTPEGVFWWGDDAVYFTDGFQVTKVNEDWPTTHKLFVGTAAKNRRIQGHYDSTKRRVWWTAQLDSATDCDTCVVLDLNWGISPRMPFTFEGNSSDSFAPSAITFLDGDLIRGDRRGYIFAHDDSVYTDPLVDTGTAAANWETEAIVYYFESCAFDFGNAFTRNFIPRISARFKNETNLSVQIRSNNDDGKQELDLAPIRYRGNITWGDDIILYGDPTYTWNAGGVIEEWRRFPGKALRCAFKSIIMTNADVTILSSDVIGTAEVNAVAETATLTNTSQYDFPEDLTGYSIRFENDWDEGFPIDSNTDDVVTFDNTSGRAVNATGSEWEIYGQPKGEVFYMLAYTLHFAQFGKTQEHFQKAMVGNVRSRS